MAEKNFTKEAGEHMRKLYESIKLNYNAYVELIGGAIGAGACAAENEILRISDDTTLLHFLTGTSFPIPFYT